jgi:hypothetical protein
MKKQLGSYPEFGEQFVVSMFVRLYFERVKPSTGVAYK